MTAVNERHVYFGFEDHAPCDNAIVVKQPSPGYVQIHLGFLQCHHTYNVSVDIPKCFFLGHELQSVLEAAEKSPPNVNCKVLSVQEKQDMLVFVVDFHADKEKLVKEEVKLPLSESMVVRLEFHARVLGLGKGTPLLKNGIKCTGIIRDEMSELSDWQG